MVSQVIECVSHNYNLYLEPRGKKKSIKAAAQSKSEKQILFLESFCYSLLCWLDFTLGTESKHWSRLHQSQFHFSCCITNTSLYSLNNTPKLQLKNPKKINKKPPNVQQESRAYDQNKENIWMGKKTFVLSAAGEENSIRIFGLQINPYLDQSKVLLQGSSSALPNNN